VSGSRLSIGLFGLFVVITLLITYFASRMTRTTAEYYAADHRMSAWQNGIAISGDYTSAASFLGVPGLIALAGLDGVLYVVGFLVALLFVLVVVAEQFHNAGRYTVADVLTQRLQDRPVRLASSLSTLSVCIVYLVAQMVGAGALVKLLFQLKGAVLGLPAEVVAIVGVGLLMVVYVAFGGMLGITWVQIIKAVLLLAGSTLVAMATLSRFGFSIPHLLDAAATGSGKGTAYLAPGLRFDNPLDLLSLGLALVFGTAGLPHIMVRFYTVASTRAARASVNWAIGVTGAFYVMSTFIGFGAAALVGAKEIVAANKPGNMAGPQLARALGGGMDTLGGDLFLAFMAALAIATILGAVAGLTFAAASSFSHDLYAAVVRPARHATASRDQDDEVRMARRAALVIGAVAVMLAVVFRGQNVAFLVGLAFAIAASANMPVLVLSLYWRQFNTTGAVAGILAGLGSCVLLVGVGPTVIGPQGIWFKSSTPLFPLDNPGIISIPVGFAAAYLGTLWSREPSFAGRTFERLRLLALTGIRIGSAVREPR
jgi:cation/acetate symporter